MTVGRPARPNPDLEAGHDPGIVDQQVNAAAEHDQAFDGAADAAKVGRIQFVDLHPDAGHSHLSGRRPPGGHMA